MVEGRPDQAHRPAHVRENVIPKKLDGTDGAEVSPVQWKYLETNKVSPYDVMRLSGWRHGVASPALLSRLRRRCLPRRSCMVNASSPSALPTP